MPLPIEVDFGFKHSLPVIIHLQLTEHLFRNLLNFAVGSLLLYRYNDSFFLITPMWVHRFALEKWLERLDLFLFGGYDFTFCVGQRWRDC